MTATYHTYGEINAARDTLLDVMEQIDSWIDALEVNRKRVEEQGHDRQARRLEDAQSYYRAVREGIVLQQVMKLTSTIPEGESESGGEPCWA